MNNNMRMRMRMSRLISAETCCHSYHTLYHCGEQNSISQCTIHLNIRAVIEERNFINASEKKNQSRLIRVIAERLGVVHSTTWWSLKKRNALASSATLQKPGRTLKVSKVDENLAKSKTLSRRQVLSLSKSANERHLR